MEYSSVIEKNIILLSRLSGIGPRSAKRILLDLMNKKEHLLLPLIENLSRLANDIKTCSLCNNIDVSDPCSICNSHKRNKSLLCVVEDISSLWAIEKSNAFNGLYYVLGGTLSASRNSDLIEKNLEFLTKKVENDNIYEIIIATSATIEGQITANYIKSEINNPNITVSMLAQGIPIGSEIEYLDDITLSAAINLRKII